MRQFILTIMAFLFFSCNSKQEEQSLKNESQITISLLTDYFHYTPYLIDDVYGGMKNIGVNELVYNLKNETNSKQIVLLNHIAFESYKENLISSNRILSKPIVNKRHLEPTTPFDIEFLKDKSVFSADIKKIKLSYRWGDYIVLDPFEELKIYVQSNLPSGRTRYPHDSEHPFIFELKSIFIVYNYDEYKKAVKEKAKVLECKKYELKKTLYYEFDEKSK